MILGKLIEGDDINLTYWKMSLSKSDFYIWTLLCVVVAVVTALFVSLSLSINNGKLILPIDDAYIYFQYARQFTDGQPFIFNPGDAPTSGATSLLYLIILAVGYLLGFHGLSMAYWAVAIGILSYLLTAWVIYRFILNVGGSRWLAAIIMMTFTVNGAFVWAAVSGMEASTFVLAVICCLYAYQQNQFSFAILAAIVAALIRPEGALVASSLVVAMAWQQWKIKKRIDLYLVLPLVAIAIQPGLNVLLTGSFSATGNHAKSFLHEPNASLQEKYQLIWQNLRRMWEELVVGYAASGEAYVPAIVVILALVMGLIGLRQSYQSRLIHPALLAAAWIVALTIAVATLSTAFWHMKRYQLPLLALMFPLAGWALTLLSKRIKYQLPLIGIAVLAFIFSIQSMRIFAGGYRNSVYTTSYLQYAMALWIDQNLPQDARVGVFDVGMIRYIGHRYTYDVVGLTTPGVASAWRQGSGAFFDTMAHHPQRPDYMAMYPQKDNIVFLIINDMMGEEIEEFHVIPLDYDTASSFSTKTITRFTWQEIEPDTNIKQSFSLTYLEGYRQIGMLDIGDLNSEASYDYTWENNQQIPGFLTTLQTMPYIDCQDELCTVSEGTRAINNRETFTLPQIQENESYVIVARVHSATAATLSIGCETTLETRTVPEIPGNWIEILYFIPGDASKFCIQSEGIYHPARYWIYAGQYDLAVNPQSPALATWFDGNLSLLEYHIEEQPDGLSIHTTWFAQEGIRENAKVFIHLYDGDNVNQAPLVQHDGYMGRGILPVSNIPPGEFKETFHLPAAQISPGYYPLAFGFYDAVTQQRFIVESQEADSEGQRFLAGLQLHENR